MSEQPPLRARKRRAKHQAPPGIIKRTTDEPLVLAARLVRDAKTWEELNLNLVLRKWREAIRNLERLRKARYSAVRRPVRCSDVEGLLRFEQNHSMPIFRCLDKIYDRVELLELDYLYRHQGEQWARDKLDRKRREISEQT
jgi:hypothetical protein